MNSIKKISSVVVVLVILGNITIYAGETENNIIKCSNKSGFELYNCESKEICGKSEYGKQKKKIYTGVKKYTQDIDFKTAKDNYKNTQNNIYKCGILNSQEIAFTDLSKKLVKYTDKSGILKTKILPKIKLKLDKIKNIKNINKCSGIVSSGENKQKIKKIILDQSTLQYCNYKYFLQYLENKQKNDLNNSFKNSQKVLSSKEIGNKVIENQNKIKNEINHSIKLYSIAFETYIQYDNFIKLHIMLELLKEDYRTFRDKLYQTLHPINQVIYKIINAQSK